MPEVLTIGEAMAVFVPTGRGKLRYQENYRMRMAGAESNTAIGLKRLGHTAEWISALGQDEFGEFILRTLHGEQVECGRVKRDRARKTGIMFKEPGNSDTRVFYYRRCSAASALSVGDFQNMKAGENGLWSGVRILHMTGITPVLSQECRELTEWLFEEAEKRNILISFDPNIRKKLWGEKDYTSFIQSLTLRAQIVLTGADEGKILWGTAQPEQLLDILFEKGNARFAAVKDGSRGAWVSDGKEKMLIAPMPCRPIEPVGAGDGFNAGFLCGLLENKEIRECGRIAAVCGALATETEGDFEGYPDRKEVEGILNGDQTVYR